jgi:ribosomal protein S18 acetylase RimI-like enzyme
LVVVAEVGGDVVGWAKTHLYPVPDGAAPAGHYLGGVTVRPDARRRGVGRALTDARMAWVGLRAARVHYLVNAQNQVSIAMHERWGFREIARGPAFHHVTFAGGVGLVLRAATP